MSLLKDTFRWELQYGMGASAEKKEKAQLDANELRQAQAEAREAERSEQQLRDAALRTAAMQYHASRQV